MIEKYEINSSTTIHMTELIKVAAANALSLVLSILTWKFTFSSISTFTFRYSLQKVTSPTSTYNIRKNIFRVPTTYEIVARSELWLWHMYIIQPASVQVS